MAKQPAEPAAAAAAPAPPPAAKAKAKTYYALRTIEAALVEGGRKTFRFGDKIEGVSEGTLRSMITAKYAAAELPKPETADEKSPPK